MRIKQPGTPPPKRLNPCVATNISMPQSIAPANAERCDSENLNDADCSAIVERVDPSKAAAVKAVPKMFPITVISDFASFLS